MSEKETEQAQPGAAMIAALERAAAFPHPVGRVDLLETHASWIVLAGDYAYKIKKPVDLGFLDFSTLELRRHFCDEELRLNGRLAPDMYLDVVEIEGPPEAARIVGAAGPAAVDAPIEFAVRMRRFPQEVLLGNVARRGELTHAALDGLAARVARFHADIEAATPESEWGTPEAIWKAVGENLERLCAHDHEPELAARIEALAVLTRNEFERLVPVFEQRRASGFVRECHGDMHLDNMILEGDEVVIFDGIEFAPNLRWIDTISEVAFTVMDLHQRGRSDLANRFLNAYLEASGDYAGLELFPFYATYRALVRAKVDEIRLDQRGLDAQRRSELAEELRGYIALAETLAARSEPRLVITYGLSGSGKTTGTQDRVERDAAIRVRSDVERKRLHGLGPLETSRSEAGGGIYSEAANARTYARLLELAETILGAGSTVIVDATFLRRADRAAFRSLARRLGVPFEIVAFDASPATLRERIEARADAKSDASEATIAVLELQLEAAEPPEPGEADDIEWVR